MKKWSFLLLAALAAVTFMVGCQDPGYLTAADLNGYVQKNDCMKCHASTGATFNLTGAKATYEESGHAKGIRWADASIPESAAELSLGESSAGCSKCHTSEGFQSWLTAPAAYTYSAFYTYKNYAAEARNSIVPADPTFNNCFTCHDPHSTENFSLRSEKTVAMHMGMGTSTTSVYTFNGGAGNLCANCHQDRDSVGKLDYMFGMDIISTTDGTSSTATETNVTFTTTPHYSIQADFLMGINSAMKSSVITKGYDPLTTGDTMAAGPHYGPYGTCVECHVSDGDHTNYLTAIDAAGNRTDRVAVCLTCHTAGTVYVDTYGAPAFDATKKTFAAAMVHKTASSTDATYYTTLFANIDTAKIALLNYFGKTANFYTGATGTTPGVLGTQIAPITTVANYESGTKADYTYSAGTASIPADRWMVEWRFNAGRNATGGTNKVYMSLKQAQAFWNLEVFAYDKSGGMHNPVYAAQLLYDAIELVKADAIGTSIPTNPWTTRP